MSAAQRGVSWQRCWCREQSARRKVHSCRASYRRFRHTLRAQVRRLASYTDEMRDHFSQGVVVFLLACCAVGCTSNRSKLPPTAGLSGQGDVIQQSPLGSSPDPNLTLKLADVERVEATYEPAPTPHVRVVISGTLNDGATRIHDIRQQSIAGGVTLSVITARPKGAMATLAIVPFERVVTVDLQGQAPGPFSISANAVGATVEVP